MAPTDDTYRDLLKSINGRAMSHQEALEYEKILKEAPTGLLNYRWVDSKTGSPVYFSVSTK